MAAVAPKRVTARIDGDFVVFLIGMRINKPWTVHKWLPVFRAMSRMIRGIRSRGPDPVNGYLMRSSVCALSSVTIAHREKEHLR